MQDLRVVRVVDVRKDAQELAVDLLDRGRERMVKALIYFLNGKGMNRN